MRSILLAATLLVPAAAMAGDRADRTLIGFSADGATFAFAESGVQDGSGFPYANVYFIDVATDTFAADPVEVQIRRQGATDVSAAVREAMAQAWPMISEHGIDTPARLLWSRPLAEASHGDPAAHGDYPGSVLARFGEEWWTGALTLQVDPVERPLMRCRDYDGDTMGFTLSLTYFGETEEIYRDEETVPQSRGCPLGYSISDIVEGPNPAGEADAPLVAILNVFKTGFEGPDRRFLAVTLDVPPDVR